MTVCLGLSVSLLWSSPLVNVVVVYVEHLVNETTVLPHSDVYFNAIGKLVVVSPSSNTNLALSCDASFRIVLSHSGDSGSTPLMRWYPLIC